MLMPPALILHNIIMKACGFHNKDAIRPVAR